MPAFPGLSVFPIRSPPSAGEAEQRRRGGVEFVLASSDNWDTATLGHGYLADVDASQHHGAYKMPRGTVNKVQPAECVDSLWTLDTGC